MGKAAQAGHRLPVPDSGRLPHRRSMFPGPGGLSGPRETAGTEARGFLLAPLSASTRCKSDSGRPVPFMYLLFGSRDLKSLP